MHQTERNKNQNIGTLRDIKLIALDIDGTLLNHKHKVSSVTKEEIERAVSQGVHVMLCTGRPADFCHNIMEGLNLNGYLITVSGGEIWTPDRELIERKVHAPEMMETLYQLGEQMGLAMWLISTKQVYENGAYPDSFYEEDWLKIGFHTDDADKLSTMKQALSKYDDLELTNSHPNNIEVNPFGVSKAHGLEKVCKLLNLTLDNVMAVGDSLNDYTMINQAGIGVAMGNAQQEIKNIADYITETNEHDGVAQAIRQFIK